MKRALERCGGIASRRELVAMGCWETELDLLVVYRPVVRVRKGWFALTSVPAPSIAAWRVGGTLACVSALQLHTLGAEAVELPLHLLVERGASRLRNTQTPPCVVHWTRRPVVRSRVSVSEEAARSQALACRARAG